MKHRLAVILSGLLLTADPLMAADVAVDQVGQKFSPKEVALAVGDSVHFHNSDDVTHNINVIDPEGDSDDQGLQKPGQDINYKFAKPGTYDVKCSIHPKMKMTVTVK